MTDLDRLASLTATELSSLLTASESAPVDKHGGDWLAIVQLLTARLTEEGGTLTAEELNLGATALDVALDSAEQAGVIDRNEAAIRRLNLMSVLLRLRGPNPDVALLNPQRMYGLFSTAVPLSAAQIREVPPNWRALDVDTIRRLRLVKNLVVPLLGVKSILEQAGFADNLAVWEDALPRLP
ncbi:conserved hypothetical protein [Catenulispora acidiphila DSM 44928]|uniref:Uncharacterized protein n=1 Tax=Catenulispora acidiphila (strain DSM 44928 / JCM 14897 / NBRC 102108 / NRRL B-24433 / ID139908) TaxID=479433 RepID=C7Q0A8_CATAD|nr:hypothetical protein [Catenulispora acidiphila]ACU77441.1 conserved hypothetical protein [Catenulispora acidiphila DSM 44928]